MKRKLPSILVLGLTLLALGRATGARAQTNAIPPGVKVELDGETVDQGTFLFVGKAQCTEDSEYTFELSMYEAAIPVLEVWVAEGTTNCSTAASRTSSGTAASSCWRVASKENVQATTTVSIDIKSTVMFDRDGEACPTKTNQRFGVYFVPLQSATQEGTGNASEPILKDTRVVPFTLYTDTPTAPTSIKGLTGEESLGVSWKNPAGTDRYTKYRLYFDLNSASAADGGECSSETLVEGGEVDPEADGLVSTTETGTSGRLDDLDGRVEVGESVAVGVVTVDAGGNESLLSKVVCVERVYTEGFYDRYKNQGGDGLTTCAALPWTPNGSSSLAALFLIALGLMARRRLS